MEIPQLGNNVAPDGKKAKEVNIIHILVLLGVIGLTIVACYLFYWTKVHSDSKAGFMLYMGVFAYIYLPICLFSAIYGGWNLKSMWYLPLVPLFIHYMLSPVWNGSLSYEMVIPIEFGVMLISAGAKASIRKWKQHSAGRRTQ